MDVDHDFQPCTFTSGPDQPSACEAVPVSTIEMWQSGRYRELTLRLHGELSQAESNGDCGAFVATANDLACVYRVQLDAESAAYFQVLAATAERHWPTGSPGKVSATSLGNLACDAVLEGRLAMAEGLLWKSLLEELSVGNDLGAAADWANLGLIAGLQGDLDAAKYRLWLALKLHWQHRDQFHLALDLFHLAQLFEVDGDWDRCRKLSQRAARLFAKIGHQQLRHAAESQASLNSARADVLQFDASRN